MFVPYNLKFLTMKKVLLVAIAGVFVLGLSSCKKDWTCACTSSGITANAVTYPNTTKKAAKDACTSYETTAKIVAPSISCEIK